MQYRLPKNVLLQTYGKNIDIRYVSDTSCTIALSSTLQDIYSISNYGTNPIQFRINNAGNLSCLYIGSDAIYSDHNVEFEIADYDIGKDELWFNRSYIDKGYFTNINSSIANIESIYCRDITANILIIDDLQLQNLTVSQISPSSSSSKIGDYDEYFGEVHTNALMFHNMDDDTVSVRAEVRSESMDSTLEVYSSIPTNVTLNGLLDLDVASGLKVSTQGNQEEIVFLETDAQSEALLLKAPTTRIQSTHNDEYLRLNITNWSADFSFVSNYSNSGITLSGNTIIQNSLDITDILFRYENTGTMPAGYFPSSDTFSGILHLKKGGIFQIVLCFDDTILGQGYLVFAGTQISDLSRQLNWLSGGDKTKYYYGLALSSQTPGLSSPYVLYYILRANSISTNRFLDEVPAVTLESIILNNNSRGMTYIKILCMFTGVSDWNANISSTYHVVESAGYLL